MTNKPFSVEVGNLKAKPKKTSPADLNAIEAAGDNLGFIDRTPQKKRGRKPSPRTGQIHAKVMPNVSAEIADEARNRGVQQGVIIEEAWLLYKNNSA